MILFLKKYVLKFRYAFQGLFYGILHDRSILIQYAIGCIVTVSGLILKLEVWEWCVILILIALVIAMEYINSAIEHIVDYISPTYHEQAKIIKDYGAASVLIISIIAAVIAVFILGGRIL